MIPLRYFPALQEVGTHGSRIVDDKLTRLLYYTQQIWIMDQSSVTKLCGLETLVHLRILNVTQCDIKKIEGLENLECLEKLFLFSNKIKTIENIGHLTSLEVRA